LPAPGGVFQVVAPTIALGPQWVLRQFDATKARQLDEVPSERNAQAGFVVQETRLLVHVRTSDAVMTFFVIIITLGMPTLLLLPLILMIISWFPSVAVSSYDS